MKVYHIFYPFEVIFRTWLHIIESVQVTDLNKVEVNLFNKRSLDVVDVVR